MKAEDEKKIQKHLRAIAKLCDKNGEQYLSMFVTKDVVDYNNDYWDKTCGQINSASWDRGKTWQKRDL